MSVKRYDCSPGVDGYMYEADDGDYVRYEDCTDLRRAAEMLAVERGEFRIRAEKAEAEVVRLRAALDDAACALMRAGAALAEFEGFEKSMERAMRRAQDDCAAAFDAIIPKKGHPMTTPNEAAMNGAN